MRSEYVISMGNFDAFAANGRWKSVALDVHVEGVAKFVWT